jgi:toxin-antitoxin system PIN domain toxin
VILVDANLLIYAIDSDAPLHRPAREWLEDVLSGTTRVGLSWTVLLAFLRITTRAGILVRPLSLDEATEYVDSWLVQPFVEPVVPGPAHWGILRSLLAASGTAGNLTSDAHIAALAIEHKAAICSTDHDFGRFPGVSHINPVAAR